MNRTEFINLILDKRSLNKEVYDLSLKIDDFPIARQVLNKIWGNMNLDLILTSNKLIDINNAKGDLIANTINFIDDSRLKSETKRFVEDLVDQKILGSNFGKKEITNNKNKNTNKTKNKKNKEIKNTSQNQLIPDPWDSILTEKTEKQKVINENSKTIPNSENDLMSKKNLYKNKKVSNLFTTIFELGAKHFHKGNYEDSIECYSLLLNQGLKNIEVKESMIFASRGCCFFELGKFNEAILDFSKAINLDNKTPSFHSYRGRCNFELGKFNEAILDFTKSLSLNKDPLDFFKRGESKFNLKDFKKAILDFNKAIDLENKTPSFFRYRGKCNFELEKYDEAISDFTKALYLEKNEKSYLDFYMRGKCKYKQDKLSYALVDLKKSIELLPRLEYNEEFFNEPIDLYNQIIRKKNNSKDKIQINSQKDFSNNEKSIGIGLKNKSSDKKLSNNFESKRFKIIEILKVIGLLSFFLTGLYISYSNKKTLVDCLFKHRFNDICFYYDEIRERGIHLKDPIYTPHNYP